MQITFSNNPIDRFHCWLSNTYEKLTQFRWQLKHHRVVCHICGEVLDSKEEKILTRAVWLETIKE